MPSTYHFRVASVFALATFVAVALGSRPVSANRQATAADKVYNEEQAGQGLAVYDKNCSSCHDGGSMGPELWGAAFLSQWKSQDAETLFKTISETMPQDAPGSLSEAETLQVIAHILKKNGYAAGDQLLNRKQLAGMKFTDPKH